jgi:hypothetical protein
MTCTAPSSNIGSIEFEITEDAMSDYEKCPDCEGSDNMADFLQAQEGNYWEAW